MTKTPILSYNFPSAPSWPLDPAHFTESGGIEIGSWVSPNVIKQGGGASNGRRFYSTPANITPVKSQYASVKFQGWVGSSTIAGNFFNLYVRTAGGAVNGTAHSYWLEVGPNSVFNNGFMIIGSAEGFVFVENDAIAFAAGDVFELQAIEKNGVVTINGLQNGVVKVTATDPSRFNGPFGVGFDISNSGSTESPTFGSLEFGTLAFGSGSPVANIAAYRRAIEKKR